MAGTSIEASNSGAKIAWSALVVLSAVVVAAMVLPSSEKQYEDALATVAILQRALLSGVFEVPEREPTTLEDVAKGTAFNRDDYASEVAVETSEVLRSKENELAKEYRALVLHEIQQRFVDQDIYYSAQLFTSWPTTKSTLHEWRASVEGPNRVWILELNPILVRSAFRQALELRTFSATIFDYEQMDSRDQTYVESGIPKGMLLSGVGVDGDRKDFSCAFIDLSIKFVGEVCNYQPQGIDLVPVRVGFHFSSKNGESSRYRYASGKARFREIAATPSVRRWLEKRLAAAEQSLMPVDTGSSALPALSPIWPEVSDLNVDDAVKELDKQRRAHAHEVKIGPLEFSREAVPIIAPPLLTVMSLYLLIYLRAADRVCREDKDARKYLTWIGFTNDPLARLIALGGTAILPVGAAVISQVDTWHDWPLAATVALVIVPVISSWTAAWFLLKLSGRS